MSRLPTVSSDDDTWGTILNDFLSVEHNADGTQKTLGIAEGGTGATSAAAAQSNLGLGTAATHAAGDFLTPGGSGASLTGITVSQISGAAPLANPTFTGTVTAGTFSGSGASLTSIPISAIPDINVISSVDGILKSSSGSVVAASAGTDYLAPTGNGSGLTGLTVSQVSGAAPLASPAFTGQARLDSHYGVITADTDAATITFAMGVSDKHSVTLGANRTLAVTGDQVGQSFTLFLTQGSGGSYTVTWWSGIRWPGGVAPTLTITAGKLDAFTFVKLASGSYLGLPVGLNL